MMGLVTFKANLNQTQYIKAVKQPDFLKNNVDL